MNPDFLKGLLLWVVISIAGYLLLPLAFEVDSVWRGLIALNVAVFLLVMIDKMSASMHTRRIPEKVLYLTTFLGGSIGMLVGMHVMHHKTRKNSFQFVVILLILVQILLVLWLVGS